MELISFTEQTKYTCLRFNSLPPSNAASNSSFTCPQPLLFLRWFSFYISHTYYTYTHSVMSYMKVFLHVFCILVEERVSVDRLLVRCWLMTVGNDFKLNVDDDDDREREGDAD